MCIASVAFLRHACHVTLRPFSFPCDWFLGWIHLTVERRPVTAGSDGAAGSYSCKALAPARVAMSEPITLKFLFANKEGVKITLSSSRDKHVSDIKHQLLDVWPAGLPKPESLTSIRLICMGLGVLQDTKTLAESKVPVFPGHPTPVNVSIQPPKSETQALIAAGENARAAAAPGLGCWCVIS
ncbi:Aste57867_10885 [Aphanomyces stellatus]|uniref:Aste57867_10885 protein n=1 Tax=Aphanomyces stellatus TaxID=120398 RepID=A0A485KRJ7_9STRA|nr:hypothetical protein As57867_010845 [Aphanomyces stellatus]VFT87753.1 Aste57867_10885 [Aphanomyces stellatus]